MTDNKLLQGNKLHIIHGDPTGSGGKFQVTSRLLVKKPHKIISFTFTVWAAKSDYTFGQLLWTRCHSRLGGLRMTHSLQINPDLIAAWRSQKHLIQKCHHQYRKRASDKAYSQQYAVSLLIQSKKLLWQIWTSCFLNKFCKKFVTAFKEFHWKSCAEVTSCSMENTPKNITEYSYSKRVES